MLGEKSEDAITMLRLLLPALARGDIGLCPRCCHALIRVPGSELSGAEEAAQMEGWWPQFPAISRTDDQSKICSECGTEEGLMEALGSRLLPPDEWGPRFLNRIEETIREGEEDE